MSNPAKTDAGITSPKYILGFSCFNHDSAACLLRDGKIVAAVEEERLTRKKHDNSFPTLAIRSVLKQAGISGTQLNSVVFYERPEAKLARLSQMNGAQSPLISRNTSYHLYAQVSGQLAPLLQKACGYNGAISYCDHHVAHAAGTYYQSPFMDAAILVVDGVGEWVTTSIYHGCCNKITSKLTVQYPHSLGLLTSTLTDFLGFESNEGEYKVMGLAAYGQPNRREDLHKLITLHPDGGFTLDLSYFNFANDDEPLYTPKLVELLGKPRKPEAPVLQRHMDLAASLQHLIEEALLHLAQTARLLTGSKNLCLSGAVAHNIVANTKIQAAAIFENTFVHFASGDNGGAIGAALYVLHQQDGAVRQSKPPSPYLGPAYTSAEIECALTTRGLSYEKLDREILLSRVSDLLQRGLVIGWHQGHMEFGPRALGNRSILASASGAAMKEKLNAHVKHREEFRPFAPAVLVDQAHHYFNLLTESPAMVFAAQVRADKQSEIPAVTHIDGSARPQTIERADNPLFYDLVAKFGERTGTPVIVNTSFNVRGEPIVCSPDDAINCFINTDIDVLVIGHTLLTKDALN